MIVPKKWPKNDCHEKLGGVGRQAQYYPLSQSDQASPLLYQFNHHVHDDDDDGDSLFCNRHLHDDDVDDGDDDDDNDGGDYYNDDSLLCKLQSSLLSSLSS